MTKAEARRHHRYMEMWQEMLRARDWEISLHLHEQGHVPKECGGGASCTGRMEPQYRQYFTRIDAAAGDHDTRGTIIHELVHLKLAPMEVAVKRMERHLPPAVFETLMAEYDDEEERAVTCLAEALREMEQRANGEECECEEE